MEEIITQNEENIKENKRLWKIFKKIQGKTKQKKEKILKTWIKMMKWRGVKTRRCACV